MRRRALLSSSKDAHGARGVLARAGVLAALAAAGCGVYDQPPQAYLPEAHEHILADATAPLVVAFSEPIDPATLRLKVVRHDIDVEGRLADEDDDPSTNLTVLYEHRSPAEAIASDDGQIDVGGKGRLDETGTVFTIDLQTTMPIGPRLAVLVEPGLTDPDAKSTSHIRQAVEFGFQFGCEDGQSSLLFPSGTYFFLVDVATPIETQIQLWGAIDVDNAHGSFIGQFTNADRDATQSCPFSCPSEQVCRLLPTPACVSPSERAGTVDEYPDYVPNDQPPTGYSFTVLGCVRDEDDGTITFGNAPADAIVQSPAVTVKGIDLTASFAFDGQGALRGSGSFVAEQVYLGTTASGAGTGVHTVRLVPDDEVPPGIPQPP